MNANIYYTIDDSVPDGWVPRVNTGFNRWSDRGGGRGPNFLSLGRSTESDLNPCTGGNSFARGGEVSTLGGIGYTDKCFRSGGQNILTGFDIYLLNAPPGGWYAGDGQPGGTQWDVQSIATHEAGHATGWSGHFNALSSYCPDGQAAQTMCDGESIRRGTNYLRTLENHDIHTINSAY